MAEKLPPFHYLDAQGKPTGALVEVVQAMARQSNLDIDIQLIPFARARQLMDEEADVFLFSFLKTPARESAFQWLGQTYRNRAFLVGMKGREDLARLKNLDHAKSVRVGTIRGYFSDRYLRQAGFTTKKNLSLSVNNRSMWPMLFRGRIDLVLTNNIGLKEEIGGLGLDPDAVTPYLALQDFPDQLHIATNHKTEARIVESVRQALQRLKDSGEYQVIIDRWNL